MNEHLTQALFSSQRKLRTFTYMNSHGSSYYKSWKEYPCTDSKTFVRERGGEICPSVVYMFKGCWGTGLNNDNLATMVAKLSTTWQVLQCYSASGDLYLFRSWPKLTNCNNYEQNKYMFILISLKWTWLSQKSWRRGKHTWSINTLNSNRRNNPPINQGLDQSNNKSIYLIYQ